LPTGKSEETAKNEIDVTGKGFFTTSLGVSLRKSVIKNRFQLIADFSWQHSFSKEYKTYFGGPPPFSTKQAGDKFNYSLTANYIFSSEHAVSFTASGFNQGSYLINDIAANNSDERSMNFALAYTYYPIFNSSDTFG
jgi:outer membrane autotransporter protein